MFTSAAFEAMESAAIERGAANVAGKLSEFKRLPGHLHSISRGQRRAELLIEQLRKPDAPPMLMAMSFAAFGDDSVAQVAFVDAVQAHLVAALKVMA
jgi:hypothetical protein